LIRDPVTRNFLAGHPTGKPKYVFDSIKGMIEPNEIPIEAAIRECGEECGISVDKTELKDLGHRPYTKHKDLHFFYVEKEVDLHSLKCESYFQTDDGKVLPEMNGYTLLPADSKMWYPSLGKAIVSVLKDRGLFE
jgi:8-oxo-dGTP pyrophosphatase MutT (NUDIX family)